MLPYSSQLDALYTLLHDAFVSENTTDFTFVVPFSNVEITIPADYVSSRLPSILVTLIRVVYWYIIARFIFRDVWHTIDKMRSGTIFDGDSHDIKTEVL